MAGEIQLNSTTMATESSGSITAELDTIRPNTTNGSLTLKGDSSDAGVTGLTIDSSGVVNTTTARVTNIQATSGQSLTIKDEDGNAAITIGTDNTAAGYLSLNFGSYHGDSGVTGGGTLSANTLNDYEQGTFTPVVSDASTGGNTATLSDADGIYTKIGDIVYFRFNVVLSNKGSMAAGNNAYIQGFPFQSASIPGSWYNPFPVIIRNTTFSGYVQFNQVSNGTVGYFRENVSGGTGDNIYVSDLTDTSAMQAAGFYKVS